MVKQAKTHPTALLPAACNFVSPIISGKKVSGKAAQSRIKEQLDLSLDKISEIPKCESPKSNGFKLIPNDRKIESIFNEDTFDSESCPVNSSTQESQSNPSLLLKVELSPANSVLILGPCSFRLASASISRDSKSALSSKKISLKRVNSLVDNEGDLIQKRQGVNLISPYIVAYRQKIKKLRNTTRPEVAISPRFIEFNTNQTTFCSCKTSQCLKLYCECFKSLGTCGLSCRCLSCQNNVDNLEARVSALSKTLTSTYGKTCFRPIGESLGSFKETLEDFQNIDFSNLKKQEIFCRCKKSNCSNNYCSCHVGGRKCGSGCNCEMCHNSQ